MGKDGWRDCDTHVMKTIDTLYDNRQNAVNRGIADRMQQCATGPKYGLMGDRTRRIVNASTKTAPTRDTG